jgi:hypothetical protein
MRQIRIELPPELHEYLVSIVRQHSRAGHEPEESLILFHTWEFVTKRAQVVDVEEPSSPPPLVPNTPEED